MSDEKIFTDGMIFKLPRQGAPDFAKGSLSFKTEDFIKWLQAHDNDGWVNVKLNVSKNGKPYGALDTWKPNQDGGGQSNSGNQGGGGSGEIYGAPPGGSQGNEGMPDF